MQLDNKKKNISTILFSPHFSFLLNKEKMLPMNKSIDK